MEEFDRLDFVFVGTVTEIIQTTIPTQYDSINGSPFLIVKLKTQEIWKGAFQSEMNILTSWDSCMFDFQTDETYLVYAYKTTLLQSEYIQTNHCDRTKKFSQAIEDFRYIKDLSQTIDKADFDESNEIDFSDFTLFAKAFGSTQSIYDLNTNGQVDFPDFITFISVFGRTAFTVEATLDSFTENQ